jgi:hypothetical protein
MKLKEIEPYFSLLANFGVILGIIFLVIEIGQNNELLAAQDRYNRLQVANYGPNLFLEGSDLTEIFYETPPVERSDSQNVIVSFYWGNVLRGLEWTFKELPRNELPTEKWRMALDHEWLLPRWGRLKTIYDPEFVEYMENYVLENTP